MCSLMMNSMRARPTPSLGSIAGWKARSGLPTLTMISVCGAAVAEVDRRCVVEGQRRPRRPCPTSPSAQETVTGSPVAKRAGGVAGADDRRDAEFARDDRRVAGAPAAVGDDRRGRLHHRLPVGRGGVGHQHLAGLEAVRSRTSVITTHPAARARSSRRPRGLSTSTAPVPRDDSLVDRADARREATVSGRACTM